MSDEKAQALAHAAITDVKKQVADLQTQFAGATTSHFAVPKHLLQELEDAVHNAEMWFLHLFPHLRAQQEQQTQPAAEAAAAPVSVTVVAGDAQPGGQGAEAHETTQTPGPGGEAAGASSMPE